MSEKERLIAEAMRAKRAFLAEQISRVRDPEKMIREAFEEEELQDEAKPEWVTRKRIHELAKALSPADAPKLQTVKNAKLPGFEKHPGKRAYVADYQKILPALREEWPQIPWPPHVSD